MIATVVSSGARISIATAGALLAAALAFTLVGRHLAISEQRQADDEGQGS